MARLTRQMLTGVILSMGGAAMGRAPVMSVWGEQLSTQEINDVVAYLRTILVK